jgi:hypothetical protein
VNPAKETAALILQRGFFIIEKIPRRAFYTQICLPGVSRYMFYSKSSLRGNPGVHLKGDRKDSLRKKWSAAKFSLRHSLKKLSATLRLSFKPINKKSRKRSRLFFHQ